MTEAEIRTLQDTLRRRAHALSSMTTLGAEFTRRAAALEQAINAAARAFGGAIGTHGGAPPGVSQATWQSFQDTLRRTGYTLNSMRERERQARAAYASGERSVETGRAAAAAGETYAQHTAGQTPPRTTGRTTQTQTAVATTPATTSVTKGTPTQEELVESGAMQTQGAMSRAWRWLNPAGTPVYRRPMFLGATALAAVGLGYAAFVAPKDKQ